MRRLKSGFLTFLLGVAALAQSGSAKPPAPGGGVFACSEGGGTVRLLWMPLADHLPSGGWRVQDDQGKVLDRLPAGDTGALAAVSKADAEQVGKLLKALGEARSTSDRKLILLTAFVMAGQSPEAGRALRLSARIKGLAGSRQALVVVGLDKAGNPDATRFTAPAVNPSEVSPFPPMVSNLTAAPQGRGLALSWAPVSAAAIPVMDYRVERDGTSLTNKPYILGASWKPEASQFVDREAGLETEHTYHVTAVDLFGRRGPAAAVTAYLPDPAALFAPTAFRVEAAPGRNLLTWSKPQSRYTTGFTLERAFLRGGPWEPLGGKVLLPGTTRFEDPGIVAGTTYFYRIRSQNSQGQWGEPSLVAFARGQAVDKLSAPTGLAIEEGTSRLRLTWKAAPRPVAGFYVERRIGSEHAWARLNPTLLNEPRFDDYLGNTASGGFQYRVTAVDFDSTASASAPVSAVLEDRTPPPVPHLVQITGLYGKVVLRFRPAAPVERSTGFLVLRSQPGKKGEVVIGDPLPGNAEEFADSWVQPGQVYRYRLLAVAANGLRSEPSLQLEVLVGAPPLEAPPRPTAAYFDKPFAHVKVSFPVPPEGVSYFLHRKTQSQRNWLQIQGPLEGSEAQDVNPPGSGKVLYRIYAQSVDGTQNRPGEGAELTIP